MATETCAPQATGGEATPSATRDNFAFPASIGQQRIWFLDRLHPTLPIFNIPLAVGMQGPLDAAVLEKAIHQIIGRHEILRTSFHLQNGRPVQAVGSSIKLRLPITDLSCLPNESRKSEALRLADAEAKRPFDPGRAPLLRVRLLRLAAAEHIFVLIVHHIIFDNWSLAIFLRELAAIYEGLRGGNPAVLPEPPVQYAEFAVWQRERLKCLDKELAWWKRRLSGSPPHLDLPTDRPRPALQTHHGAIESLALPSALRAPLLELSQREDATLFMTLLAAFQTLLHRYTCHEDILVGSLVAGRRPRETENVIGPFANTLVMRGDLSGNPTFRELLGRVRDMTVGAYANEEAPF